MILTSLKLFQFRNYDSYQVNVSPRVTLICGDNARGKTNILEAIYLLATGESFRAQKIEEMVKWEEEVAHVIGEITDEDFQIRVTLTRGMVQGKRAAKRGFVLNGVPRRKSDVAGLMPAILFRPEDMDLISGSSSLRRRFLDEVLTQVDGEYARSLDSYEKALRRRNKLLDLIRDGSAQRTTLAFWDMLLVKEGNIITRSREKLISFINMTPSLSLDTEIMYDLSPISPERLEQYKMQELAVGYTLVGPHKDDFRVMDKERDLAIYGSRGEQRMAVLWLKEAQLRYIEAEKGERPLLLLDDILSELDTKHEEQVLALSRLQQTFITTTDDSISDRIPEAKVITL
jgi:DNA replication and repair protein RecF